MTTVSEQQTQVESVTLYWQNYECVEHTAYNVKQQRIILQGMFVTLFFSVETTCYLWSKLKLT